MIDVMERKDDSFRQNFETLLALFKKLADKMSEGEIEGVNPQFAGQFRMMLNQYEMMKNMMPDDIPEHLREPFRQMMEKMIHQLKDEIGEDIILTSPRKGVSRETEMPSSGEGSDEDTTISEIEDNLRKPGLDPAEIDKLLDRLAELKSQKG
ncbi:MAG: hypothetical protein EA408_02710 [Marinilabiliales bacterium]|nr:MAG: hypothetical protein EA408_02710 [Marinilabiliales bacterium]